MSEEKKTAKMNGLNVGNVYRFLKIVKSHGPEGVGKVPLMEEMKLSSEFSDHLKLANYAVQAERLACQFGLHFESRNGKRFAINPSQSFLLRA